MIITISGEPKRTIKWGIVEKKGDSLGFKVILEVWEWDLQYLAISHSCYDREQYADKIDFLI